MSTVYEPAVALAKIDALAPKSYVTGVILHRPAVVYSDPPGPYDEDTDPPGRRPPHREEVCYLLHILMAADAVPMSMTWTRGGATLNLNYESDAAFMRGACALAGLGPVVTVHRDRDEWFLHIQIQRQICDDPDMPISLMGPRHEYR